MHLTDVRDIPAEFYPFLGLSAVVVVLVVGTYGTYCLVRRRRDRTKAKKIWASQKTQSRRKKRPR